ncbi:arylsulfatase [Mycobacterium sp. KBS0706]|uniref:arylsulfatase n=1 Tax=Mycobacterium sp. KBS0706 TaxID=2578109 RepID=UPI00110F7D06|nr:arylsulfatase [Mycobacterium sp. KBS0706]TSD83751.1 arylsulfatase [Mycobacterium sp. KBS0706]
MKTGGLLLSILSLMILAFTSAGAQEVNAVSGSPSATAPINPLRIPNGPGKFGGTVNLDAPSSTPYWQPQVVPPKGAPNILLVLIDDEGFGAPSTFGGVIPTPNLDRIANSGLRYTQFHTTSLCSPTRAALITGRNHHSVGFGVISEASTGYPGYNSVITKDKTTIGAILKANGYATSWFGKNHNTPAFVTSQAGPFDQWPNGMGFEYFYGFNSGETNQWQPDLYRNSTRIYPYLNNPGYNLITDMADDAIDYLGRINALDPKKPFFLYYAPGATHAPHHPTQEWIDKFKGKFSMGWNALRDEIFANQKRLGVIPQDAQLTPWPHDLLKNWDELTAEEKKLFERQMEVYAAYLAYNDYEIGRVVQAIEDMGKLDNTLIIYISGDNGASAEGSPEGTPNEMTFFNGVEVPVADQMPFYDVWGSSETYPHYAVGWAWAMSTPYKWTKQVAGYLGGTRNGMVISWPSHIIDAGGIRNQFHHVIDIVPTILEVAGIQAPDVVDGIDQAPIEGVSLAYTFDKANADAPSKHRTQYFEMFGERGIYHDGWMASTVPFRTPWNGTAPDPKDVVNDAKWELYDLTKDWTQNNDVAAANPTKLAELQDLFWIEASKYQVLPLDASALTRFVAPRPSIVAGRNEFVYTRPLVGTPLGTAPNILNKSFSLSAEIEVPAGGGEGMLVTQGGRFAGWGFYLLKGKPIFVYSLLDLARPRIESPQALSAGKHIVDFVFTYDGPGFGKGGTGVIKVDGVEVARGQLPHTLPFALEASETFDIGSDTGTGVDDADYLSPFPLTGQLGKLTIKLGTNG